MIDFEPTEEQALAVRDEIAAGLDFAEAAVKCARRRGRGATAGRLAARRRGRQPGLGLHEAF